VEALEIETVQSSEFRVHGSGSVFLFAVLGSGFYVQEHEQEPELVNS
jgi:hypothetical protein